MNDLKLVKSITEPLRVEDVDFGDQNLIVMAGPCAVEDLESLTKTAQALMANGIRFMRAGAYKPRTSPYSFQGLGKKGLEILAEVKAKTGIRIVTEITSAADLPDYLPLIDIIQVGARNMQNFELLKALGRTEKPILLKRGFGNTIEEWLDAAEYILLEGNSRIILCERGIRTFETETRNTLDISSVPIIKKITSLPVIVDPSHASGRSDLIAPLAMAAVAAGANGLLIEVHVDPKRALSDKQQALSLDEFIRLNKKLQNLKAYLNSNETNQ
jgi:3-deoxy-7-phosphoheptulonate synthase